MQVVNGYDTDLKPGLYSLAWGHPSDPWNDDVADLVFVTQPATVDGTSNIVTMYDINPATGETLGSIQWQLGEHESLLEPLRVLRDVEMEIGTRGKWVADPSAY